MGYKTIEAYESRHNLYKDDQSGTVLLEAALSVAFIIVGLILLA